jgi:hypothetical protein
MLRKEKPARYTVRNERAIVRYPWLVVDAAGEPALWRQDPKLGKVPLRFRSRVAAQAAADRLNNPDAGSGCLPIS